MSVACREPGPSARRRRSRRTIGAVSESDSPSLRSGVEHALAAGIVTGEIPPGTLLSVPQTAARYGVSATPAREAMLELERRGFVEPARNRGFTVTQVGDAHTREVADVRLLLEPPAMALLAPRFDPAHEPRLRALAAEIMAGAASGDLAGYLDADRRFHLALTDLVGNPMLTAVVADLRARTRLPGLVRLLGTAELAASSAEHGTLLDLLLTHDAAGAEALMRTHIRHTVGWWAGHHETSGGSNILLKARPADTNGDQ